MRITPATARRIALFALAASALGACQDATAPTTAPLTVRPHFTEVASAPVVNSLADPGNGTCDESECTLREAIAFASPDATITFSVTGTITLSGTELEFFNNVTVAGPGASNLTVSANRASRVMETNGGGITISGLTITGGYATDYGGAAIANWSTLNLIDCLVTGNSSGNMPGVIRNVGGKVFVKRSTISADTAAYGGIYSSTYDSVVIVNSTISGNRTSGGGATNGVYNALGKVHIVNSTITGNLHGIDGEQGTAIVRGSLVWGNSGDDVYSSGMTFNSTGHNLIGTGSTTLLAVFTQTGDQTGVANANIAALAVNSPGQTPTHALVNGSSAIDNGVCTDNVGATITTDQRGVTRPQGSACDIGAYELVQSGGSTPTFAFNLSSLPAKTFGDPNFSVASYATTNSTGAITFATGTGSVGCSVTPAGLVSITGAAVLTDSCILEASLAADATYTAAGPISSSFHIAKATGSVTISNLPSSGSIGGSFTPTYTKSGDGIASTTSNSTSVCTVTSGVVDFIATGTCLLRASVTEGTNYLAATGTQQSFEISLVTPTFSFNLSALPAKTFGDGNFSVAGYATTNSSGAITFGLGAGSVGCSVTSAGMVTISGAAVDPNHCILSATLAASGTYAGAGPIDQSFNIAKAPGSVTINNMPLSATVGGSFTPTFTKAGDGTASVTSLTTGVCTVSSGVVNFNAAGTCTLRASVTAGTNYLAATGSQQSVTVSFGVFSSSCTYTINAKNNQRQVIVSWENANPGVTQIEVLDGRGVTKQLAPTLTGSWSTNVKTGSPTYGLWGGTTRRDTSTQLVPSGSACTLGT